MKGDCQLDLASLPQVAETNPPQPLDVVGEGSLYDEFIVEILHNFLEVKKWKSPYRPKLSA